MAATVASIKARCPEFTSTATATIELAIADALTQLATGSWSADQADLAHIYLSAHILKMWDNWATAGAGSPGAVKSLRDGDLGKTFAVSDVASQADAWLGSTVYGLEFIRIRDMGFAPRVMGSTS